MPNILFIINPGSTSTKIGLFHEARCIFDLTINHQPAELQLAGNLAGQLPLRLAAVDEVLTRSLAENQLTTQDLTAIVARGGLLKGLPSGTYRVNSAMLADLQANRYGEHASNLGAVIADRLASRLGLTAYVVDPPSVDEMDDIARFTGSPRFRRRSIFHALNQKAVAREAAVKLGKPYEQCKLIVAHLGGGISVGAHLGGRVVDVTNALEEGPFSPERAGSLPTLQLLDFCFSSKYSHNEISRMLNGKGGLFAYTGLTDVQTIEQTAARPDYRQLLEAMAYQIAKEITAMAAVLSGQIDAVVLTGGIAHSQWLTSLIIERVAFLGPVMLHPGEDELAALAAGARRVIEGTENCREYSREPLEHA